MIVSHKSFGKFAPEKIERDGYKYLVFKDADGVEWHDRVAEFGPFDFYLAIDDANRVRSMEADPDASQISGLELIGIKVDDSFSLTRGPGGTVYGKIWNGSTIVEPEPEPIVTVLPSVTLWERMSHDEADQVEAVMATQPVRTRQIFLTANTFRSDHELWPLLVQMANDLFGEERAKELLTP